MADGEPARKSDMGVRTVSAIGMVAVSGLALWAGGWVWTIFVLAVGVGVWFEWSALCLLMFPPGGQRSRWRYSGAVYCGLACATLMTLRDLPMGMFWVLLIVGAVIGTDVGAYLLGRAIGGPKIAPRISPSKTWAGLVGGMIGAALMISLLVTAIGDPGFAAAMARGGPAMPDPGFVSVTPMGSATSFAFAGAALAVIAQAGDFFESWMKRRAGVKDSGRLLPGHGGLFDRVDGLLAVLLVIGVLFLAGTLARMA